MKRQTSAVRSVLGGALLAASLFMMLTAFAPALRPSEQTAYTSIHEAAEISAISLQAGTVDVNHGSAQALTALPGIGPVLAQAIIDEREAHGMFFYPEDLMAVKGIGEKKLFAMRDLLDLKGEAP